MERRVYITPAGARVHVFIVKDCGLVKGEDGRLWHKVLCEPIGFNNSPLMSLDYDKLEDSQDSSTHKHKEYEHDTRIEGLRV